MTAAPPAISPAATSATSATSLTSASAGQGPESGTYAERAFACTTAAVPLVRSWMRRLLQRAGVGADVRERAELLITEVAANAVLHGHGQELVVQVHSDSAVEAAVADDDPTPPVPRGAGSWDSSGRGMALVSALADGWGVRTGPGGRGKWVWFRLVDRERDGRD